MTIKYASILYSAWLRTISIKDKPKNCNITKSDFNYCYLNSITAIIGKSIGVTEFSLNRTNDLSYRYSKRFNPKFRPVYYDHVPPTVMVTIMRPERG